MKHVKVILAIITALFLAVIFMAVKISSTQLMILFLIAVVGGMLYLISRKSFKEKDLVYDGMNYAIKKWEDRFHQKLTLANIKVNSTVYEQDLGIISPNPDVFIGFTIYRQEGNRIGKPCNIVVKYNPKNFRFTTMKLSELCKDGYEEDDALYYFGRSLKGAPVPHIEPQSFMFGKYGGRSEVREPTSAQTVNIQREESKPVK